MPRGGTCCFAPAAHLNCIISFKTPYLGLQDLAHADGSASTDLEVAAPSKLLHDETTKAVTSGCSIGAAFM